MEREEYAIILDYLPYGYPLEGNRKPIAQAIGITGLTLLHLVPRKGILLKSNEKVYIGMGKRDKIYYILGKLGGSKLTENAKQNLSDFITEVITNDEKKFIDFFNKSEAINTRLHQIELLPGFGKKHTREILEKRKETVFENFEDLKNKIPSLPNPLKAIEKRIANELIKGERHRLFIR